MDVLIDTNVILNFVTGREDPFSDASIKIIKYATEEYFRGFVAIHSISTMWYVLRKGKTGDEARFLLDKVCRILIVANISREAVKAAIHNKQFRDFEDCLQDECAYEIGADYLVTCNEKDFYTAKTTVVTPSRFLQILEQQL